MQKLVESEVARKDMKKLQNEETKCKKTIIAGNPCGCRERKRESHSLVDALVQSKSWIKTLTTSEKYSFMTNIKQIDLHSSVSLFAVSKIVHLIWKNDVSEISKVWWAYLPYLS